MGKAAELAFAHLSDYDTRVRALRDRLRAAVSESHAPVSASMAGDKTAYRIPPTSVFNMSKGKRFWFCSTSKAFVPPPAQPVPPALPSLRMFYAR